MKGNQLIRRFYTSHADYKRVEKCYTRFKNIKNNLERHTGRTEHIFRDILETEKCDKLSDFSGIREGLFKEVDCSIIKKLQTKIRLNAEEEDILDELRANKKEHLMRHCAQKMKSISPFKYYIKETNWESIFINLVLADIVHSYLWWILQ